MHTRFKNPLSGKPYTVKSIDRTGHPKFKITPYELTPLGAKFADFCCTVLGGALAIDCIISQIYHPNPDLGSIVTAVVTYVSTYYALAWFIKENFRRKTTIVMTTDAISVRRWYGWQRYDRNLEHRFALHVHDRAQDEQRCHDYELRQESAKGQVVQKIAYYGESFHIVLLHAGHRVDLLTVYGQKESTAIIARLQYCDRCLNEAVNMNGGINNRPEDEWNQTPGGLNDA